MERRTFVRTAGGIACFGLLGSVSTAAGASSNLVNAEVTSSGAVVATGDNFVISGQQISVDGGSFYTEGGDSYVVYNDGYSGTISGNSLDVSDAVDSTFGIRVDGGNVEVTGNTISADDDVGGQFLGIGAGGGATARVDDNDITGAHRVGVLGRGSGTSVPITNNTIVGSGPRSDGWADNGIQIDQGAMGQVRNNVVDDHWYTPNSFQSAGLLLFSDNVAVQRNQFGDNDVGIALSGDQNNVIHNTVEVSHSSTDTDHYGVFEVGGRNNGIRQNTISTEANSNGAAGIIVLGTNAKLIRNSLSGWETPILDGGNGTKLPQPFDPAA